MKKILPFMVMLTIALLFENCKSKSEGFDKYLGTWVNVERNENFTITKNGDTYSFVGDLKGFNPGYRAVLTKEKENLIIKGFPLAGDLTLSLVDNGTTILLYGVSFKKQ